MKYKEKEKEKMVEAQQKIEKAYKQKVIFLRRSKKGAHLFAFNYEGALGGDVGSIIIDVSEVEKVIAGKTEWCKVGVIPAEKQEEGN